MRRWHQDRALMERRVKFVRKFFDLEADLPYVRYTEGFYRWREEVVQTGRWRKRKPLDCSNPKCWVCHGDKFFARKARLTKKQAAIQFEIDAYEGR